MTIKINKVRFYHRIINSLVNWWRCNATQRFIYRTQRCFTTLYTKQRCYGGPEEGDWYYTHYEYVDHYFTPFGIGHDKAEKKLKDKFFNGCDPADYDGIVVYRELKPRQFQTQGKPIYQ